MLDGWLYVYARIKPHLGIAIPLVLIDVCARCSFFLAGPGSDVIKAGIIDSEARVISRDQETVFGSHLVGLRPSDKTDTCSINMTDIFLATIPSYAVARSEELHFPQPKT